MKKKERTVWITLLILLTLLFFEESVVYADVELSIEQKKEKVDTQYEKELRRFNWYYRLAFALTGYGAREKVLARCDTEDGSFCSEEQLARAVHRQIAGTAKFAGALATYSVALSCIVLSAYGGSKFNEVLARRSFTESQRDFVRVFIPIITGFGVFSVGAPLWDPVRSFIRRWAFASNQYTEERSAFAGKYPERPDLENFWMQMQKYFSVNAQMSRNVLSAFLVLSTPTLQDARHRYDEGEHEYAAVQFAKMMVQMRFLYSEISPDQEIIAVTVRSYMRGITPPRVFYDDILQIATEIDPLNISVDGRDYYIRCIKSWFDADYTPLERQ